MFSLTSIEEAAVIAACSMVVRAETARDQAVYEQDEEAFGMAKARLQSQIARLFSVVASVDEKGRTDGTSEEPPF